MLSEVMQVEQVVYGDVLFFINFCMDFQCLFLAAKLMHRPFAVWRSVLASALGAFYACAALFLAVSGIYAFVADCSVCLMMCIVAFCGAPITLWRLLTAFLFYLVTSFAVGGVMSGIAALLSHVQLPLGESGGELSAPLFFALAVAGGLATLFWGRLSQRRIKGKQGTLTLCFAGARVTLRCAVDTANLLHDPVSGRPVALLDQRAAASFLPATLLDAAENGYSRIADLPRELFGRVRLIPARTAVGDGMLLAIAPDSAVLDMGGGGDALDILLAPVCLNERQDACAVLLPAELIVD